MSDHKKERVLTFIYYYPSMCNSLIEAFKQNNIDYIVYNDYVNYYSFTVLKSGKTWSDIINIINTVYASKYTYKTITYKCEMWEHGTVREVA